RIRHTGGGKSHAPQPAGVAAAAGAAGLVRLIARYRLTLVDPEPRALADDLGLGQADERGVYAAGVSFDTRPRCERGERDEGGDELRPTVGVATGIGDVHADEEG